jgi:hypothetical protein
MTTPDLPNWIKALVRSVGVGVGIALTLSAIGGLFLWYSNRLKPEKPWNQSAIEATATGSLYTVQLDRLIGDFRY